MEKRARYGFGEVLYYIDALNVTDRVNVANRAYPLRNALPAPGGGATILPDDEEGVPRFVAVGVNFSF